MYMPGPYVTVKVLSLELLNVAAAFSVLVLLVKLPAGHDCMENYL